MRTGHTGKKGLLLLDYLLTPLGLQRDRARGGVADNIAMFALFGAFDDCFDVCRCLDVLW